MSVRSTVLTIGLLAYPGPANAEPPRSWYPGILFQTTKIAVTRTIGTESIESVQMGLSRLNIDGSFGLRPKLQVGGGYTFETICLSDCQTTGFARGFLIYQIAGEFDVNESFQAAIRVLGEVAVSNQLQLRGLSSQALAEMQHDSASVGLAFSHNANGTVFGSNADISFRQATYGQLNPELIWTFDFEHQIWPGVNKPLDRSLFLGIEGGFKTVLSAVGDSGGVVFIAPNLQWIIDAHLVLHASVQFPVRERRGYAEVKDGRNFQLGLRIAF